MSELSKRISAKIVDNTFVQSPGYLPPAEDLINTIELVELLNELDRLEKNQSLKIRKVETPLKQGIGLLTVTVQVGDMQWQVNNYYETEKEGALMHCMGSCEEALLELGK